MIGAARVLSGEMHYARIPCEYWNARLEMARAMGVNTISTYVFWNRHERTPDSYDFTGENDIAHFIRLAQRNELHVILRPGPYVCAEWDFGGLPAWLLRDGTIPLRTADPRFLQPVRRWLSRLGKELAPLQDARGGPIVAVQLENEYGAYGSDRAYLEALREVLREAGFTESPLFTIDQPGDLARGALEGVAAAVTFAPGDPGAQFAELRKLRPDAPLLCGEYWAGWFDHWGEPRSELDEEQQIRDLEWMLAQGASLNVYMLHGGTNFGFWNGANAFDPHPYQPTVSSYDYQAAIDEAGRPTGKYHRFREIVARATGVQPPAVPAPVRTMEIAEFELSEALPLLDALPQPVVSERPVTMEALGQDYGYIMYRTVMPHCGAGILRIEGMHDYAVIAVEGSIAGHLDRRLGETQLEIIAPRDGAVLDVVIENGGRINYGSKLATERKGIVGSVYFDGKELMNWQIFALPFERPPGAGFLRHDARGPSFFRGTFCMDEPADTFVDVRDVRKGALWINGRCAGRIWEIGPQRSLYVPAPWLRSGENEAVVLEFFERESPPRLRGGTEHVFGGLPAHGCNERPNLQGQ
jgi:beta-galactosidase